MAAILADEAEVCRGEGPDSFEGWQAGQLGHRSQWERAERLWLTELFEWCWLSGLTVFAAWPWLRGAGPLRWALHLGAVPTLLMLPHLLGYAPLCFTSCFPGGGVWYPHVVVRLPVVHVEADTWIASQIPPLFEPLHQLPGPILGLTGFSRPGPLGTAALSVAVAAAVLATAWTARFTSRIVRSALR
jgi:hypothetical protein